MTADILRRSDLTLKTCLETFKTSPFTIEEFLSARKEFLIVKLAEYSNNYIGIVSVVIRELFADTLRQAFTLFINEEKVVFEFINKFMLPVLVDLRRILKESSVDRCQLTQMWHSTVLAGEALKPFSADFSAVLNDLFVSKMLEMIKKDFEEGIRLIEPINFEDEIILGSQYDLNTTIALNSIVDAVNQVRLCPHNEELKSAVFNYIHDSQFLKDNLKSFAKSQLLL